MLQTAMRAAAECLFAGAPAGANGMCRATEVRLSIVPSTSIESTGRHRKRPRVQAPAFRPLQIECEAPGNACAYVRCHRGRHHARGWLRAVKVSVTIPENLARRRFGLTSRGVRLYPQSSYLMGGSSTAARRNL